MITELHLSVVFKTAKRNILLTANVGCAIDWPRSRPAKAELGERKNDVCDAQRLESEEFDEKRTTFRKSTS